MYPHQAERLTEILDRHGLEALVASREANVAYVTGFRGVSHTVFEAPQYAVFTRRGTGLVVPAVEIASIVADGIEVDQTACFGDVVATYDERAEPNVKRIRDLSESRVPDAVEALGRVLDALGVRAGTVALDEGRVTHEAWQRIAARLEARRLVPGAEHFLSARRVKGPWEIECLVRGLGIVEEALNEVIAKIAPGMTEREAVTLYQSEVLKRGGEPRPEHGPGFRGRARRIARCAPARSFASTWAESSMGIRQRSRAPRWRVTPTRVWTRRIGPCRPDSTLHSTRSSLACPGHALTPRRSRRRARRGSRASRSATSVMRSASKRTSLRSWLMTSTRRSRPEKSC
ncbi:MAG: hypothetical protein DMD81_10520 [Candidatus Rokuibacteriota bacterium]|nr:MAG: hypothetical protein DMD81_10520 [Candidatus Rokubacteria bacterium]